MKRIVTFLLVLVMLVGIMGYSPVSADTWDEVFDSPTWKYRIKIVDESILYKEHAFYYDFLGNYIVDAVLYPQTSIQLCLVNKKGKRIKSSKVEFEINNPDYFGDYSKYFKITKRGKVTYLGGITGAGSIRVVVKYKGKLVKNVYADISGDSSIKAPTPWEDYEEAWNEEFHLVPKGYKWCPNTLDWYRSLVGYHTIRTREAVMLVKGTKQKWVLKSCLTGETISLDKCKIYVENYDEGALKLGKKATTRAMFFNGLYATPEARIYVIYGDKYYWCDVYIYDTEWDAWIAELSLG